jgi:hypothetical protein
MAQQDSGHGEWVNAWAETPKPEPAMPKAEPFVVAPVVEAVVAQPAKAAPISPDQLMRDIAEIERVRDALAAQPAPVFAKGRTQALTLVPARTTDAVPVVIGGVLALVMLTVFGAAAAMTKLAR